MPLNLTKVAYGAGSLEDMRGWFSDRGYEARLTTRNRPRRVAELAGGSLFWIFKHQLVARSPILRFEDAADGRTHIVISAPLIDVCPVARRAHQGWRYLEERDAPPDLAAGDAGGEVLPPGLANDLARLGLV